MLGLSAERGDQLVVESLPFEQTRALEESLNVPPAPAEKSHGPAKFYEDRRVLIGGAALLGVLILALAFLLLRKRKQPGVTVEHTRALDPGPGAALAHAVASETPMADASGAKGLPAMTSKTQSLLTELQENVVKDPQFAANIVRSWLED